MQEKQQKTAFDRVMEKLVVGSKNQCWPWTGARTRKGSGAAVVKTPEGSTTTIGRVIFEHYNGRPVKPHHVIKTTCGSLSCGNPHHQAEVEFVSVVRSQNKVSDDDVREIRAMALEDPDYQKIGAKFGISEEYARNIAQRKRKVSVK